MSNPRHLAIRSAAERTPRIFARPLGPDGRPLPVRDFYGSHTFDIDEMREHLPADVVRQFLDITEHGEKLEPELADRIAQGTLDWALERGVTHFCHWFQPMTGATAEKHDGFLAFDGSRPIAQFTAEQLLQSEPDASSFPSGGIRSTFEARGYTAWDPTSPMFIAEQPYGAVLCIPSAFFSYNGEALDKKTPLLRSMEAIDRSARRLLALLGEDDVRRVVPTAGPEQEYFLIDKAYAAFRPDLTITGRTVLGAPPPKGQTLEDHYFGAIASRALSFMHELELELYKLGVPAKTRHNEVAPSQFELAVLYRTANIAADHNQIVMELVRKVAARHDLFALMHEKPFAGVNGSGKHLNWSLACEKGNLLNPGQNPGGDVRFLAFLAAILTGVDRYGALLRASIATHGNDFRLGANEAPPAILSVFLGEQLTEVRRKIVAGEAIGAAEGQSHIELGVDRMPRIARHSTDRNRTSPFAFTGDKFEFRAVGANTSVSFPLACVHVAVAAGIEDLCDRIEARGGGASAVKEAIRDALRDSERICFEGNNYADAWVEEAERRGLPNHRRTPEALAVLQTDEVIALFGRFGVLNPAELEARYHVKIDRYATSVEIEVQVMRELVDQSVLAAAEGERNEVAAGLVALEQLGALGQGDRAHLDKLNELIRKVRRSRVELDASMSRAAGLERPAQAALYAAEVIPALEAIREASDKLEQMVSDARWVLPRYREMLFQS